MPYKDNCGFKKIKLCTFKEEDCKPEECDMFSIEFTSKGVLKTSKQLRKRIVELHKSMVKMKKAGEHKTDAENYKATKKERNDLVSGMLKLSQAHMHCKRTGK